MLRTVGNLVFNRCISSIERRVCEGSSSYSNVVFRVCALSITNLFYSTQTTSCFRGWPSNLIEITIAKLHWDLYNKFLLLWIMRSLYTYIKVFHYIFNFKSFDACGQIYIIVSKIQLFRLLITYKPYAQ